MSSEISGIAAPLKRLATHPFGAPGILGAASVLILGAAYYFEFVVGLAPCQLCYWQRLPYFAAVGLTPLMVVSHAHHQAATLLGRVIIGLIGLGFSAGAGIGIYHVGVEQSWWPGPASCSGAAGGTPGDVQTLLATPVVRCDEVPWSLFGISMAGYNVMLSLALAAFALGNAWAWRREHPV